MGKISRNIQRKKTKNSTQSITQELTQSITQLQDTIQGSLPNIDIQELTQSITQSITQKLTQIATTNKNNKEDKEYKEDDDDFHAYAREALEQRQWVESVCMKYHIDKNEFQQQLNDFILSCKTLNRQHEDIQDFQSNFVYWLGVTIQRQYERQKIDEKINKRFQDRRSRIETTATSWKDYEGPF